jgi:hypothetical protein
MSKAKGKKAVGKELSSAKKVSGEKKATAGKAAEAKAAKPAKTPNQEQKVSPEELASLRKEIEEAKGNLTKAQAEAKALADKAHGLVAGAKDAFRAALAPYREACRKAGVECEYESGRSANVSEKVSFLVEKTDKGIRVMVKGQPKTEEVIPLAALKESINKAAYAYTDKHIGPKEEIGNKGGSLSNRLRVVMA